MAYSAASSKGRSTRSSAKRALISTRHCPQLNFVAQAFMTQLAVSAPCAAAASTFAVLILLHTQWIMASI